VFEVRILRTPYNAVISFWRPLDLRRPRRDSQESHLESQKTGGGKIPASN
jgi:hypothetical protein